MINKLEAEQLKPYRRGRCRLNVGSEYYKTGSLRDGPCQISGACRSLLRNPAPHSILKQKWAIGYYNQNQIELGGKISSNSNYSLKIKANSFYTYNLRQI